MRNHCLVVSVRPLQLCKCGAEWPDIIAVVVLSSLNNTMEALADHHVMNLQYEMVILRPHFSKKLSMDESFGGKSRIRN